MLLWKEFENNTTGDLRKISHAHHFNHFMNIRVQFQSDEIGARTISFTESIVNAMLSSFILLVKVILSKLIRSVWMVIKTCYSTLSKESYAIIKVEINQTESRTQIPVKLMFNN